MMKVVIDRQIPFIKGRLEPLADISYIDGQEISRYDLADADAVIIRTRTKVNRSLLENTRVRFVGTATIGTDHIDKSWCRENGIYIASAPGCNAGSVMQYIASALAELQLKHDYKTDQKTLGIIGVGNVGSKVSLMAKTLGYRVLHNDPPRERKEGSTGFTSLKRLVMESDIITLHVPLTFEGKDKTFSLVGSSVFEKAKEGLTVINTSRGGVIDENQLLMNLKRGKVRSCILDVWEGEPDINRELLKHSFIASPHIAGYSVDGKLAGVNMILKEFADFFDLPLILHYSGSIPLPVNLDLDIDDFPGEVMEKINKIILYTYPIMADHYSLSSQPGKFEELRNNYMVRREFHNYTVSGSQSRVTDTLSGLGFNIKTRKR